MDFLKTISYTADPLAGRFVLNLGTSKLVLDHKKVYKADSNGFRIQIVGYKEYRWRNCVKDIKVVPEDEPNPHILIVGMSGYGKSTLFKAIITDINKAGKKAVVFDAHNEHEKLIRSINGNVFDAELNGISLLELCGSTVGERISNLTSLFKSVFSLGHVQTTKLSDCLWYTYRRFGAASRNDRKLREIPKISDLIAEINIFIRNSRSKGEMNTLTHLRDRISTLNTKAFSSAPVNIESILTGMSSFSLSQLKSKESQVIYIGELLRRLYLTMKDRPKEQGLSFYVMLDEAQFLINSTDGKESVIADLIAEGRKYGVGLVVATHTASGLSKRMISNISTFISFYCREPTEINYVANLFSGGNNDAAHAIKEKFKIMKQNEAIVMNSNMREPTLINTPRFTDIEYSGPAEGCL